MKNKKVISGALLVVILVEFGRGAIINLLKCSNRQPLFVWGRKILRKI